MRICVVGSGYVGLVAATCFAESGNDVVAVDIDEAKVERLRRGELPIYEPGLAELVKRNGHEERLSFTTKLEEGMKGALLIFMCIQTPSRPDGSVDLDPTLDAVRQVGRGLSGYAIVVLKSTVPMGTAERVEGILREETKHPFDVVSNPEFLKEGAAVDDFLKPDRVVVGTTDPRVAALMKELYAPFVRTGAPVLVMDRRSAELTKYAANALLATRISFMNEIANLAGAAGADVNAVREGVGSDRRIGHQFLFAGCGYGGSCFPKDIDALVATAREHGQDLRVLEAVRAVNKRQKRILVEKVVGHFGEDLAGLAFAVWGLAFKPRTDDMREAPSLDVIEGLLARGARVRASDPEAIPTARRVLGDRIDYCEKDYEALDGADALVVVTEWNEYRRPNFERMRKLLRRPVIFDGRNIYTPSAIRELGFTYYGIGC